MNNLGKDDARLIDFGLSVLSPRWTSEILIDLATGPKRTTQLLKDLKGVSAKTLCQRLRKLTELGLVSRATFAEVPPRVEYSLTDSGKELTGILYDLKKLGAELYKNCKTKKRLGPTQEEAELEFEQTDSVPSELTPEMSSGMAAYTMQ